jgi:hypothetical protein
VNRGGQELGRPVRLPGGSVGVGRHNLKEGRPKAWRESDHRIVLGDGKTGHRGKAVTGSRSLQRKHDTEQKDRYRHANLPAGDSEEGASKGASVRSERF